jgi:hypothetical protein
MLAAGLPKRGVSPSFVAAPIFGQEVGRFFFIIKNALVF